MALGQLGWTPEVFWDSTPREFYCALQGQFDMEQLRQQQDWERARWMAWWIIRPHLSKEIEQKEMIEFPWEIKAKKIEIPTDDDVQRILERDKKLTNGRQ